MVGKLHCILQFQYFEMQGLSSSSVTQTKKAIYGIPCKTVKMEAVPSQTSELTILKSSNCLINVACF